MNDGCAAQRQLYVLGIAQSDIKSIVNKILLFSHTPSASDEKTEWVMQGMVDYELDLPECCWGQFMVEVLGVEVMVWPTIADDDWASDIFLDIWWRCPNTREDCIVDGKIVDQFVDAIGAQNCKMITFTTGELYLMTPEESVEYADLFVVLHKR
jgi:hypothetical protein